MSSEDVTALSEALLDSHPVATIVLNQDGCCTFSNSAMNELAGRDLVGLSKSELMATLPIRRIESSPVSLPHPLEDASHQRSLNQALTRWEDGRFFSCSARPLDRAVLFCLSQIPENLNNSGDEAAEVLDLRLFNRVVSHDLQEPLRAISGFLAVLREKSQTRLAADELQFLEKALECSDRMIGLLQLTRSYNLLRATTPDRVDLNEVISEVKLVLARLLEESNAVLECQELPVVEGWRIPLIQLFQNLVTNSIRYCSEKQPLIKISSLTDHDSLVVTLEDNASGIDERDLQKIFEPGFRANTTVQGLGLGLFIVKRSIELHSGRVSVKSQPARGTAFRLEFPGVAAVV